MYHCILSRSFSSTSLITTQCLRIGSYGCRLYRWTSFYHSHNASLHETVSCVHNTNHQSAYVVSISDSPTKPTDRPSDLRRCRLLGRSHIRDGVCRRPHASIVILKADYASNMSQFCVELCGISRNNRRYTSVFCNVSVGNG